MTRPQCPYCGRFVGNTGARNNRQFGYANAWSAVGTCLKHGEVGIDWEWLGDFDPEEVVV